MFTSYKAILADNYNYQQSLLAAKKRRKLILSLSKTKTHTQIARQFGITKQRVGQILSDARRER